MSNNTGKGITQVSDYTGVGLDRCRIRQVSDYTGVGLDKFCCPLPSIINVCVVSIFCILLNTV